MKLLAWYCVIISTFFLISFIVVPTQTANLPWHVVPIMCITIIFYSTFFWLAALNKNIPVVLAYISRVINIFYGLIALLGIYLVFAYGSFSDFFIIILILPLFFFCEKVVRVTLKKQQS